MINENDQLALTFLDNYIHSIDSVSWMEITTAISYITLEALQARDITPVSNYRPEFFFLLSKWYKGENLRKYTRMKPNENLKDTGVLIVLRKMFVYLENIEKRTNANDSFANSEKNKQDFKFISKCMLIIRLWALGEDIELAYFALALE